MMAEDVQMEESSDADEIINSLIKNDEVYFKSQQRGEKDLTDKEKIEIVNKIFSNSKSMFLSRFGKHLRQQDLKYFERYLESEESYEINFYLNELNQYFSEKGKKVDVKNRRYCFLNQIREVDAHPMKDYFSETEMMRRNPLLYDQLVGQFLTEEEKKMRDNIDTQNITLFNLILESIDRKNCQEKKNEQQDYEDSVMEEEEDSDASIGENIMNEDLNVSDEESSVDKVTRWGEYEESQPSSSALGKKVEKAKSVLRRRKRKVVPLITASERRILKDEFFSIMYENFIEGRDKDFDYSLVDNDVDLDNFQIRNLDLEEKYFDSESPEEQNNSPEKVDDMTVEEGSSNDELDVFMERLNQHTTIQELTSKINRM